MSRRKPEPLTKTIAFIDFNIFEGAVMLSCGYTYEELLAKFGRRYPTWIKPLADSDREFKECWGFASAHRWEDKQGKKAHYWLIINQPFDFSDESMVNLAHEVLHICQFVLSEKINRDRDIEFEAYFHSYIMKKCLEALRTPVKK